MEADDGEGGCGRGRPTNNKRRRFQVRRSVFTARPGPADGVDMPLRLLVTGENGLVWRDVQVEGFRRACEEVVRKAALWVSRGVSVRGAGLVGAGGCVQPLTTARAI